MSVGPIQLNDTAKSNIARHGVLTEEITADRQQAITAIQQVSGKLENDRKREGGRDRGRERERERGRDVESKVPDASC